MATPKKRPSKAKKKSPSTQFILHAPNAKEVFLVGDFNHWQTTGYKMRRFKDGTCKKSVKLAPGRYEYLFLVDGEYWTDPENMQCCSNPFGSHNSVIEIS